MKQIMHISHLILKTLFIFLTCFVVTRYNASGQSRTEYDFTKEEIIVIRKCNTARFSIFESHQMKEFIKLMNLARMNPALTFKYVEHKYGESKASELPVITYWNKSRMKRNLLRPSFGLHLGAFVHAIGSGIGGTIGHQNFEARLLACLNWNVMFPGNAAGENCAYGDRLAIDNFIALMNSSGHRGNILNPSYIRTGVSRKWHARYQYNCVTMFSGPKIRDWVTNRKAAKQAI